MDGVPGPLRCIWYTITLLVDGTAQLPPWRWHIGALLYRNIDCNSYLVDSRLVHYLIPGALQPCLLYGVEGHLPSSSCTSNTVFPEAITGLYLPDGTPGD